MKVVLYAVYDSVADEYGPLFQAKSDSVAARQYRHLVEKESLPLDEFLLFRMGDYVTSGDGSRIQGCTPRQVPVTFNDIKKEVSDGVV